MSDTPTAEASRAGRLKTWGAKYTSFFDVRAASRTCSTRVDSDGQAYVLSIQYPESSFVSFGSRIEIPTYPVRPRQARLHRSTAVATCAPRMRLTASQGA